METTPGAVVVAVGGHGSNAAVEYAAGEALRRHRTLHLVHAVDPHDVQDGLEGRDVLGDAVRHATSLLGELGVVTSSLAPGAPVPTLVHAGAGAELVVVGRGEHARRTHPYVRSVTGGVGARVEVPVVSVPVDWQDRPGPATVVAGVDGAAKGGDVLAAAFAAADARDARLVVLSTSWHPSQTHVTDRDWAQRTEDDLQRAIAAPAAAHPDVPVELHVRSTRAGEALIEASRHADLVVVGRHTTLVPAGSHLGPIARSVLRDAACPVLLVAPRATHRVDTGPTAAAG